MVHGDNKGLVLPPRIAQYQVSNQLYFVLYDKFSFILCVLQQRIVFQDKISSSNAMTNAIKLFRSTHLHQCNVIFL